MAAGRGKAVGPERGSDKTTKPEGDYEPVLFGDAPSDYERYLRTDELLALQKTEEERTHHDELLFQTVHQSSELWLKHACVELESATTLLRDGDRAGAMRLLRRATLGAPHHRPARDARADVKPAKSESPPWCSWPHLVTIPLAATSRTSAATPPRLIAVCDPHDFICSGTLGFTHSRAYLDPELAEEVAAAIAATLQS